MVAKKSQCFSSNRIKIKIKNCISEICSSESWSKNFLLVRNSSVHWDSNDLVRTTFVSFVDAGTQTRSIWCLASFRLIVCFSQSWNIFF